MQVELAGEGGRLFNYSLIIREKRIPPPAVLDINTQGKTRQQRPDHGGHITNS